MEKFSYKAQKNGKLINGTMEGKSIDEISSKLKEKGYDVLSIKQSSKKKSGSKSSGSGVSFLDRFKRIKKGEKVFLYKNIATMLKAGLPLPEVVELMRETVKNPRLEEAMVQLKYDVENGNYVSTSLSKFPDIFPNSEIAMIESGEVAGTLPESFQGLYEDVDSENKLIQEVKGAMTYPVIILSILVIVILLLFIFVLPQLTGFFTQSNMEVPAMTKLVMAISDFLRGNFVLLFIVTVVVVVIFRLLVKKSTGFKRSIDKFILKIPFVGTQFQFFFVHRITRSLGNLIKSGVPILQALDIVEKSVSHTGYSRSVREIRSKVKRGSKLSDSVEGYDQLYPLFVSRMLKVGDKTGDTSDALKNIAEYYHEELQSTLSNLTTIIEPVLMVILGVGVAFVAITVIVPLYKIVSGINQM